MENASYIYTCGLHSYILHILYILHLASYILHLTSYIFHVSCILRLYISHILYIFIMYRSNYWNRHCDVHLFGWGGGRDGGGLGKQPELLIGTNAEILQPVPNRHVSSRQRVMLPRGMTSSFPADSWKCFLNYRTASWQDCTEQPTATTLATCHVSRGYVPDPDSSMLRVGRKKVILESEPGILNVKDQDRISHLTALDEIRGTDHVTSCVIIG